MPENAVLVCVVQVLPPSELILYSPLAIEFKLIETTPKGSTERLRSVGAAGVAALPRFTASE